jgi:hypothetical protein
MQFSKLKVGTEYLVTQSTKWREFSTVSDWSAVRARLDSDTRYAERFMGRGDDRFQENSRGDFVRMTRVDDGRVLYRKPGHIRAPWDEAQAVIAATKAERDAFRDKARAVTDVSVERAARLRERAAEVGLTVFPSPVVSHGRDWSDSKTIGHSYTVTEGALSAFLDALDNANRRVVDDDEAERLDAAYRAEKSPRLEGN